ncbi:MAG: hypothetical protein ACYTEL_12240 [Planctomycetota bacterium]
MKRYVIYSVAGLVVVAAGGMALAHQRGWHDDWGRGRGHKGSERARWAVKDANAPVLEDANRPRHGRHRGRMLRRAFRIRMERLEAILEIAADEGATKTVEALDELMTKERQHMRRIVRTMHKRQGRDGGDGDCREAEGAHHWRGRRRHKGPRPGPDTLPGP